ncbi:Proteasome maturation protein [Oryzias melastigma]|uniref:Proteasome maturation protein n=1 Tax=Oryzias melastigma TaxID=30732 RepID=A0A834C833_ORYME|nr:Proteasome maturation protein [Oryzias melastigma]
MNSRGLRSQLKDSVPVAGLCPQGAYGVQDSLRSGFTSVKNELLPSHPLELSEKNKSCEIRQQEEKNEGGLEGGGQREMDELGGKEMRNCSVSLHGINSSASLPPQVKQLCVVTFVNSLYDTGTNLTGEVCDNAGNNAVQHGRLDAAVSEFLFWAIFGWQ